MTRDQFIVHLADTVNHTDNIVYEKILAWSLSWISTDTLNRLARDKVRELPEGDPIREIVEKGIQ